MPEEPKTTLSRPVEPVTVGIIGTGDGSRLPDGMQIETPGSHQPNVLINVVTPVAAIAVRFINTFLTGLLGILTGAMATNVIEASDFLHLVYKCAGLAVAGAGMGFIKDCITIFGKLETKYPLQTGSI